MADLAESDILRHVFRHRRLASWSECARQPCDECFAVHRPKLAHFLATGQPVHFVILAFPAKSPNRQKVLGDLPDLGEKLSIEFLQSFCDRIGHFYPPGARITIASDGHVFGELVGVTDAGVTDYGHELRSVIEQTGGDAIDVYGLAEALGASGYDELRARLERDYATPLDELRERIATDPDARRQFNGIHRFLFEDQVDLVPGRSREQVRRASKSLAYQVIQRSNAWSDLVAERYPHALRLSIHPQPAHSEKIGFQLLPTADNWLTPWHGVVLDDGNRFTLVKRHTAERRGATLVWRNNRPSHYVAPGVVLEEAA
ncbi:isocyanide synthase family protein [Actinophytocola sp.]|uniref:isocyanide synthase family protein n=1 Tax=Actinophytocola sp. TaxID=1872138 RepID=UPI002EDA46B6